jgi:hypothetical protein
MERMFFAIVLAGCLVVPAQATNFICDNEQVLAELKDSLACDVFVSPRDTALQMSHRCAADLSNAQIRSMSEQQIYDHYTANKPSEPPPQDMPWLRELTEYFTRTRIQGMKAGLEVVIGFRAYSTNYNPNIERYDCAVDFAFDSEKYKLLRKLSMLNKPMADPPISDRIYANKVRVLAAVNQKGNISPLVSMIEMDTNQDVAISMKELKHFLYTVQRQGDGFIVIMNSRELERRLHAAGN